MAIHVVPLESAAKVVHGLLSVRSVVAVVAAPGDGSFAIDRVFERTRARRSDLEVAGGEAVPVRRVEGGLVIQVAGPDIAGHGAVTGHARAMCETNMAAADRLIVHVDPTTISTWTNGVSDVEGVETVVVA